MNLIEVKNLSVCYKSNNKTIVALKGINFSVNVGDYVCILGKNGAGKSTLIKSVLGIIKPKNGKVYFKNLNKKDVSYVPQIDSSFENMLATVFEITISGTLKPGGLNLFYTKKNKQTVDYYLKMLGIKDLLGCRMSDLSGGQKKKVLLARAFCSEPKVLVLDEPCASLDENSSKELYSILKKLNKEKKIAIIMVIHNEVHAKKNANKLITLKNGCVEKVEFLS